MPILGERVAIRRLVEADLSNLYDLEIDEEVKRYVGGPVKTPREAWIDGMRNNLGPLEPTLVVTSRQDGTFIGRASLTQTNHLPIEWEIRVLIARQYWGPRFGREVSRLLIDAGFNRLHATALVAVFDSENKPSQALVDSFGFQHACTKTPDELGRTKLVFKLRRERYNKGMQATAYGGA